MHKWNKQSYVIDTKPAAVASAVFYKLTDCKAKFYHGWQYIIFRKRIFNADTKTNSQAIIAAVL